MTSFSKFCANSYVIANPFRGVAIYLNNLSKEIATPTSLKLRSFAMTGHAQLSEFMTKKCWIFVWAFIAATLPLVHISQAGHLPVLEFEYTCPDSCGFSPEFKLVSSDLPYLKQLRLKYDLDDLVANCSTELEQVLAVTNWVNNLWDHHSSNRPVKSDPISILAEVIECKQRFRCVEYAIVLTGCLNALGLPSRILRLKTADVETREYGAGHVVTEVYLRSLQKWMMVDVQANTVPILDGRPLNAVELQAALVKGESGLDILTQAKDLTFQDYANFIAQYLYYFQTDLEPRIEHDTSQPSVMLVPIGARNPTVFQRVDPIVNVVYTSSVACFYQAPRKS